MTNYKIKNLKSAVSQNTQKLNPKKPPFLNSYWLLTSVKSWLLRFTFFCGVCPHLALLLNPNKNFVSFIFSFSLFLLLLAASCYSLFYKYKKGELTSKEEILDEFPLKYIKLVF